MRILDYTRDAALHDICIYLTLQELEQLRYYLKALLAGEEHHFHLSEIDEKKAAVVREITVTVFREDLSSFDERSRRLIETGE